MLTAVAGLGSAFLLTKDAGSGTRSTVLLAGALAGGLGGETGRMNYVLATAEMPGGSLYRDAMLSSQLSTAAIIVASLAEGLWLRFVTRK